MDTVIYICTKHIHIYIYIQSIVNIEAKRYKPYNQA